MPSPSPYPLSSLGQLDLAQFHLGIVKAWQSIWAAMSSQLSLGLTSALGPDFLCLTPRPYFLGPSLVPRWPCPPCGHLVWQCPLSSRQQAGTAVKYGGGFCLGRRDLESWWWVTTGTLPASHPSPRWCHGATSRAISPPQTRPTHPSGPQLVAAPTWQDWKLRRGFFQWKSLFCPCLDSSAVSVFCMQQFQNLVIGCSLFFFWALHLWSLFSLNLQSTSLAKSMHCKIHLNIGQQINS